MINPRDFSIVLAAVATIFGIGGEPRVVSAFPNDDVAEPLPRVSATAPDDAPSTLRLQDGFRAELIAAEPLVTDPIAMQYDENGLAYVVEMNDYPYSDKSHDQAWTDQTSRSIGRIRVLADTDEDGVFDQSVVFAEGLSWPSGIALWKGGVYVTATPDIWYLKDLDGDHRADVRRKVFTGFRKYNVQAVVNNLQWGLDHRIYAAGSSNGGDIRPVEHQTSPAGTTALRASVESVRLGRNDLRFDPRTERFEVVSGGARFGHTFDDWGNRFLCNIRNPVQHVVFAGRYLRRNAFLPVYSAMNDVARSGDAIAVFPISPAEPWRTINAQRLAADTAIKSPYDSTIAKGFVTSCSGVTIYRGAAYPAEFAGNAFVGEVAGNLVMRYRLTASGNSFEGIRAYDQVEFLASTDNWFRPVNFINAPDGMLHVLDMYRETIEHPWSMPDDLKARVDLTSGRNRGRIYRLVPPRHPPGFEEPQPPKLGSASTLELVGELENPNGWWRETAHRLIFERQDGNCIAPLQAMLRTSRVAVARMHALWSLHGVKALTVDDIRVALTDTDHHVRTHGVRLSEPWLKPGSGLLDRIFSCAADDHIQVRFQAALTLGEVNDPRVPALLAAIARRDVADPWSRIAVLSSLADSSVPFLLQVLDDPAFRSNQRGRELIGQLAFGVAARNTAGDIDNVLAAIAGHREVNGPRHRVSSQSHVEMTVVKNLGAGLRRSRGDIQQFASDDTPGGRLVRDMIGEALRTLHQDDAELTGQRQAIELVGLCNFESASEALMRLVDARRPQEIQRAAMRAMIGFPDAKVGPLLLKRYAKLTPELQSELVSRLMTRSDSIRAVLDAIDARIVPVTHVSRVRRQIFMKSSDPSIRERSIRLFGDEHSSVRTDVVAKYQRALTMPSDRTRGKRVFRRVCASCHRLGSEGYEVGPNLATVQNRSAVELLVNVLDPNRDVSPNYMQYVLLSQNGRSETGIIASETATSVTLRQAEGKQQAILRKDIEEIRSLGISLMPDGLEKDISHQEMADLITYLRSEIR